MNNGIKLFVAFAVGAAAGSVVTWKLVKTKYEKIAQEEITTVRNAFEEYKKCCEEPTESSDEKQDCEGPEPKEDLDAEPTDYDSEEYQSAVRKMKETLENGGYVDYSKYDEKGGSESMVAKPGEPSPKVIPPDEFGEDEEYDQISLTYFADGVIIDEWNRKYDEFEIRDSIGENFAAHFGQYEDDSVFVRNDRLETYYEILADVRTYEEAKATWLIPWDDE